MNRQRIGGRLDYSLLAQLHRPRDLSALAAAARELQAQGLSVRDVAEALGVTPQAAAHLVQPEAALTTGRGADM